MSPHISNLDSRKPEVWDILVTLLNHESCLHFSEVKKQTRSLEYDVKQLTKVSIDRFIMIHLFLFLQEESRFCREVTWF